MASQICVSRVIVASACLLSFCARAEATPKSQARQDALVAIHNLKLRYPRLRVVWRGHQAGPHLVTGLQIQPKGQDATTRALRFIADHRRLLGGIHPNDLRVAKVSRSAARQVVFFHQWYRGAVVFGRSLALTMTKAGKVIRLSSDLTPITTPIAFRVSKSKATALINKAYSNSRLDGQPIRGLWPQGAMVRPVWRFFLTSRSGPLQVELDAETGRVIRVTSRLVH